MTRLHDAFDTLADRGEPVGSDTLLARARQSIASGTVEELQPAPPRNRMRYALAAAALVVVLIAAVALVTRNGTTPTPAQPVAIPFDCHGSVAGRTSAHVKLRVERDARAQVSLGAYTFRVAIVERDRGRLYLEGRILGPRPAGGSSMQGGPVLATGHRGGIFMTANVAGGPFVLTCTR